MTLRVRISAPRGLATRRRTQGDEGAAADVPPFSFDEPRYDQVIRPARVRVQLKCNMHFERLQVQTGRQLRGISVRRFGQA